jgi:Mrp family chromosome partitioning ATPase
MSKMFDALKNLSAKSGTIPLGMLEPGAQPPALAAEGEPASATLAPVAIAADAAAVADPAKRMRELMLKHLAAAPPAGDAAFPAAAQPAPSPLAITAALPGPKRESVTASSIAQSLDRLRKQMQSAAPARPAVPPARPAPPPAPVEASPLAPAPLLSPKPEPPSPIAKAAVATPAPSPSPPAGAPQPPSPAAPVPAALAKSADSNPQPVDGAPRAPPAAAPANAPIVPSRRKEAPSAPPPTAHQERDNAGGMAIDRLALPQPAVTSPPNTRNEAPAAAPSAMPQRVISRQATRLEQRVRENLADPSRSLPYRELAERLSHDLRLLTRRCLLFTGLGPASQTEDVLPHLAALLAEEDRGVLLVDADFHRAAITVALAALKEPGLGDLADSGMQAAGFVLPTLLPNVSLLPSGRKAPPDTIGIVDHVGQLLSKLEERYPLVLIDGGPHTGTLVPALGRLCDATYFVVRIGSTDARTASAALKSFRASGARVMGCIATCSAAQQAACA